MIDMDEIKTGVYRIYWDDTDVPSVATVYISASGEYMVAPSNWITPGVLKDHAGHIYRMVPLNENVLTGMQTIEYWEVTSEFDRDYSVIGNFTKEVTARVVAEKAPLYRNCYKKSITIFNSVEAFENNSKEKLRERGLSKLTIEEKIALGLDSSK